MDPHWFVVAGLSSQVFLREVACIGDFSACMDLGEHDRDPRNSVDNYLPISCPPHLYLLLTLRAWKNSLPASGFSLSRTSALVD